MQGTWDGDETQDLWCPSSAPGIDRQSIFHSLTRSSSQVHPDLEILLPFYRWGWRRQWQPTPVSCLENPMDGGAWKAAVHRVAKSRTRLRDFTLTFHFHALEKEMATHSSVLAWRIPGTGEPVGLPSLGSHRVGHD